MSSMEELLEQFNANFEAAVERQEKLFKEAAEQFDALTVAATQHFQSMVEEQIEAQKEQSPKPAVAEDPPAAAWINSPVDGEEMLVMNKPAVSLIMTIFDNLGEIIQDEQKQSKQQ